MSNTPNIPSQNERFMATAVHLASAFAAPFLAPLIGYFIFQSRNDFAYRQAREGLNFQISVIIYSSGLAITLIGIPIAFLVLGAAWLTLIYASVQVYNGLEFRFPLTIRFVKN